MLPDKHCAFQTIMTSILYSYIFWKSALGTSCPEARRADNTNNSRFYYCIDLPFSSMGHVWIPATCNYGLVFNPLLKMCVLRQDSSCPLGKINSGNSNKHTFEETNIESPNTAPGAAVAILSFLQNSGNAHHPTHHTSSTTTATTVPLLTRSPNVQNTNNWTILPDGTTYQGGHEKSVTTVTSSTITTKQIQTISTMEDSTSVKISNQIQEISTLGGSSTSVNGFPTGLLHAQWNSARNITCITGIRLPNLTDCTRYYMCNSTSGTILPYTCPPQTAFNPYKHICETSVYNWCKKQLGPFNQTMSEPLNAFSLSTTESPSSCSTPGKTPDPHSKRHYIVCYFQSGRYVHYRNSCPNTLVYCAKQKVCTKQIDC